MHGIWEQAANIIAASKPYFCYLSLLIGFYAAKCFLCSLVPGPQHRSKLNLRNRTVLITGASSGLGRELAFCFYRRGAKLILTARSIDKLKGLCQELKSLPGVDNGNEPVYKYLDVSEPNGVVELVSVANNNKIDVLVNNAGLSMRGSCRNTTMNVHRQVMEVNYFGHVAVTSALLDYIPEDGAIVYISSLQGRIAVPFRSSYSASKHAAQAFFDCLRTEERFNTQILVVSAAYINTGFGHNALKTDGTPMNIDDSNQLKGFHPNYAAECIVNALVNRKTELVLAPLYYRLAIFLRWFFPNLFFYIMFQRGRRSELCDSRGYIKFNRPRLQRDFERIRKGLERVTGDRNVPKAKVNDFFRRSSYLLGSYVAGCLLGYTFG